MKITFKKQFVNFTSASKEAELEVLNTFLNPSTSFHCTPNVYFFGVLEDDTFELVNALDDGVKLVKEPEAITRKYFQGE